MCSHVCVRCSHLANTLVLLDLAAPASRPGELPRRRRFCALLHLNLGAPAGTDHREALLGWGCRLLRILLLHFVLEADAVDGGLVQHVRLSEQTVFVRETVT
jgi:hypothetical protein